MPTSNRGTETRSARGLLRSLKDYLAIWVDLLKTRLDLFATDLEEERNRVQELAILAASSALFIAFGMLLMTLFVVVIFWDTNYRLTVLGGFAFLYLAAGTALGLVLRRKIRTRPRLFAATLGELAKDARNLSS